MANYIKDLLEEYKADDIICTKKENDYLITLEQIGRNPRTLIFATTILSYVDWINSNLKDRHWEEITKKTGINQTPHEGFTFQNILDQGMIKHLEICSEVGEKAYREAKFEEQLKGIEMKWKEIFFVLTENKLTHLPTIANRN